VVTRSESVFELILIHIRPSQGAVLMLTNRISRRIVTTLFLVVPLFVYFAFVFGFGQTLAAVTATNGNSAAKEAPAVRQIPVPRPPMGWSSWNSFSNTVDSDVIMQQAKALVASGAQKAGYVYVNIDEGWWKGERDANGNFVVDPKAWPALAAGDQAGDLSNIVKYIHRLGLKAGMYTDAGGAGCGHYSPDLGPAESNSGSEGYYEQDMLQFAKWGFDYVKVDWCGGNKENLDPAVQYAEVARAIAKAETTTGHRLFFSICNWGNNSPWTWAPGVGGVAADIWRTSGDIVAPVVAGYPHSDRTASFAGMLGNFDHGIHPEAQHTGFFNDPDMMVIGMPGLSDRQNRVHMGLWAISGAPLILGADLTKLSKATVEMITNPEVIAIDQDALGLQCVKVDEATAALQVWAKPLAASGSLAVLLLNRTTSAAPITVSWSELGLDPSSPVAVRDIWAQKDLGHYPTTFSTTVPAEDAVMLTVKGKQGKTTRYENAARRNEVVRGAAPGATLASERSLTFKGVTSTSKSAYIRITYINGEKAPQLAELRVNGHIATRIALPSTGSEHAVGSVTIEAPLETEGAKNVLSFSSLGKTGFNILWVDVLSGPHEHSSRP